MEKAKMCNYRNIDLKNHSNFFANEPFSRREAWSWLISNSEQNIENTQYKINLPIRFLANQWLWHKSKVERFLKQLSQENLITITQGNGISRITMDAIHLSSPTVNASSNIKYDNEVKKITNEIQSETKIETAPAKVKYGIQEIGETISETKTEQDNLAIEKFLSKNQYRDKIETEFETALAKVDYGLQEIGETEPETKAGQLENNFDLLMLEKEEKKKRSKKRKEENTKEKYSLKGIQKERYEIFESDQKNVDGSFLENDQKSIQEITQGNFQENALQAFENLLNEEKALSTFKQNEPTLSKKNSKQALKHKAMEEVEISDVAAWAEENLPAQINLEWELAKFQDYYLASAKKLPKDPVAAFRNWLRKAAEFKNLRTGDGSNERHKTYSNGLWGSRFNETTGFQRFLAAGIRAVS